MSHCESTATHMDNIKVKISEKYKPPKHISFPMSYSQRLVVNEQLINSLPSYNFKSNRAIKSFLIEWKAARKLSAEEDVRKCHSVRLLRESVQKNNIQETTASVTRGTYHQSNSITNNILIPTVASSSGAQSLYGRNRDQGTFNFSDFEADTSSPFDNMELKTINDMEELAFVLNKNNGMSSNSKYVPSNSNYSNANNSEFHGVQENYNHENPSVEKGISTRSYSDKKSAKVDETICSGTNISNLLDQICKELNNVQTQDSTKDQTMQSDASNTKILESNPIALSYLKSKEMCYLISNMGFPLDRVVRAQELIGNDDKKIVEYLLVMSELMDLGFSEETVTQALIKCNNVKDRALEELLRP